MDRRVLPLALVVVTAVALWAAPGFAQSEAPSASPDVIDGGEAIEVVGIEYAFVGLPGSPKAR